ncbi:MAG: hypothetical protein DDG58_09150 [Ardenticatenia bacterium]|nr:MAG: hypothetical protein DDG58_09150 [Ardenticatenia bacterium]
MRSALFVLVLIATLALAAGAQAMSSTHYKIEWLMAFVGSGGQASSTHYRAQFTVGQMAVGCGTGSTIRGCWGFWPGGEMPTPNIYLPVIMREAT